jgi:hypothetical protein
VSGKSVFFVPGFLLLTLLVIVADPGKAKTEGIGTEARVSNPIVGRWDLRVEGTDGPYPSWLEVTEEAGRLKGRFVGRFGSARPIAEIGFADGVLRFRLPRQYEQRKADLEFTGEWRDGQLRGKTIGENGKELRWTGRRAPALPATASPVWEEPVSLFNGQDLRGWKVREEKAAGCWSVDQGSLTNRQGCVDLMSEARFSDFKLRLEVKLAERAANGGQPSNSGIYLRGRYEVQVLDDAGQPPRIDGMGSVYGFLTPRLHAGRAAGEWQTYEITLLGREVTVVLNGQTILERAEIPGLTGGAIDSLEGEPGPLMLQGDHGKVWYRNITLTPRRP